MNCPILTACYRYKRNKNKRVWHDSLGNARDAKNICVYYDGTDMEAYQLYEITIKIPNFDAWKMGTIDVGQKSLKFEPPSLLSKAKDSIKATIVITEIEAPLAFKSAGENFEKFLDEMRDQWRGHVMNMVKEGMSLNKMDPNKRIGYGPMHSVLSCLQHHVKSIKCTEEFEDSFKAMSLWIFFCNE